jgi:hypothetical protein
MGLTRSEFMNSVRIAERNSKNEGGCHETGDTYEPTEALVAQDPSIGG